MFLTVLLFLVGLAIIIKGGDWFVEAAVWVAEVTGVPKMLIGATIVSLATTLPELFVSVIAVANDATGAGRRECNRIDHMQYGIDSCDIAACTPGGDRGPPNVL